jgi:hypothetical protein
MDAARVMVENKEGPQGVMKLSAAEAVWTHALYDTS